MITKEERFNRSMRDMLFNLSESENGNAHNLTGEKIQYYKGILMSVVSLTQAFYNVDWMHSVNIISGNLPLDCRRVVLESLPESWRADWKIVNNWN